MGHLKKRVITLKMSLILILTLFLSGILIAQENVQIPEKFSIKGKVINADTQKEIVGATLTITSTSKHHISGKNGNFNFSVLPGSYELAVSQKGFKSITKKLEITKKDITNLIISLEPED